MIKYEIILKKKLNVKKIDKFTITRLCSLAGTSQIEFQRRYGTMANFVTLVLNKKLRYILRTYNKNIEQLVYDVLVELHDNKIYYANLFMLISKGRKVGEVERKINAYQSLKKTLFEGLEDYMRPRGPFYVKAIDDCSSHICSRIQVWISHDFKEDPQTIFKEFRRSLRAIEHPEDRK